MTGRGGFGYPNLQFGRPGGSILVPWDTILVIQGSLGTHLRTPGGPDLDLYRFWVDFGTLLGATLRSFG